MYITVCPLRGLASIPGHCRVFQVILFTAHTLPTRPEPARQKMAQSPFNCITQLVQIEETD